MDPRGALSVEAEPRPGDERPAPPATAVEPRMPIGSVVLGPLENGDPRGPLSVEAVPPGHEPAPVTRRYTHDPEAESQEADEVPGRPQAERDAPWLPAAEVDAEPAPETRRHVLPEAERDAPWLPAAEVDVEPAPEAESDTPWLPAAEVDAEAVPETRRYAVPEPEPEPEEGAGEAGRGGPEAPAVVEDPGAAVTAKHDVPVAELVTVQPPPPFVPDALTAETVVRKRSPGSQQRQGGLPVPEVRALLARARRPVVVGSYRLAVISLKGGVGKTTTTAALGGTLASVRGDRVVAVDANPDRGTLGERVADEYRASVRDLLAAREDIERYGDVRSFTVQAASQLEILASDADPGVSLAFSEQDYRTTLDILQRFYDVVLTDCGTGLLHSAMRGVLGLADALIVVSSPTLDGARSASATLDWLEAHSYGALAKQAITVITGVRADVDDIDVDVVERHFAARCRAVVRIPYDPHLAIGGLIDIDALEQATADAYLQLAAAVGDGIATPRMEETRRALGPGGPD